MPCRSSTFALGALLTALLVGCGDGDAENDAYRKPLPLEPLASEPRGEPHRRRFVPVPGAVYEARVEHEVSFEGGPANAADAPATRSGRETWHVRVRNGQNAATATLGLIVDGAAKRPLKVTYAEAGPRREPGGGGALMQLTNGPDLAGFAGLESWLPDTAVRVGETWDVPHLHSPRDIESVQSLRWSAPMVSQTAVARLDAVADDGSWHVRLASRQRLAGVAHDRERDVRAKVLIVDRITGTAQIDADGQPERFELRFERIEEANGQRVQHARRHIRGTVRRVK